MRNEKVNTLSAKAIVTQVIIHCDDKLTYPSVRKKQQQQQLFHFIYKGILVEIFI